jgi:hypothetical protein
MGDYQVTWKPIQAILTEWKITPMIDLFATAENHKLRRYVSTLNDQKAAWIDAFARSWKGEVPYIHVAPGLLPVCLKRIKAERLQAVVLAPMWPSQPWWDTLKRLTVRFKVVGAAQDLLTEGKWMKQRGTKLPPGLLELSLLECHGF